MADIDLWGRIERSSAAVGSTATITSEGSSKTEGEKATDERRFKRKVRLLDATSVFFWIYVLVKVFFVDVDRHLVRAVAPSYEYLVDYRFLVYAGVIALIVCINKRWLLGVLYILLFPILLVAWKIPAFFIRRKSWPLFLGTLQALFTALADFRYNLVSKVIALFAAIFILTLDGDGILAASLGYLVVLLTLTYFRSVKKTVKAPSFLRVQREKIGALINSGPIRQLTQLSDDVRRDDIDLYSFKQLTEVTTAISWGIAINRGLYFWSYQLERFRKNIVPSLVSAAIAYVWLFVGTITSFAFVNYALLKLDPSNFTVKDPPLSFLRMVMYSFSRLFLNDGGGVGAASDGAYAIQLAEGAAGVVFLTVIVANFFVTARRERDETELTELVNELKRRAREHEARFQEEFYVSVDEARQRLENLGTDLTRVLTFLTSSVPPDFFEDHEELRGGADGGGSRPAR